MQNVGTTLRALRRQKGMTLRGLASAIGVSATYVDQMERNERGPSEATATRLADVLGLDSDVLLLASGKVPSDIVEALRDRPERIGAVREAIA